MSENAKRAIIFDGIVIILVKKHVKKLVYIRADAQGLNFASAKQKVKIYCPASCPIDFFNH